MNPALIVIFGASGDLAYRKSEVGEAEKEHQSQTERVDKATQAFEPAEKAYAEKSKAFEEAREQITGLYRRVWAHSDTTVEVLALDAVGHVPWWPPQRREVTLHRILVHVIAETNRHAGHADIVRELIDGSAGLRAGSTNRPAGDDTWWEGHRDRVERAARQAGDGSSGPPAS